MMKKPLYITTILALSTLLAACSSKEQVIETRQQSIGMTLTEMAYDYAMQGRRGMAEFTYDEAIEQFRNMGSFCDMARVSIVMHSVSHNIQFNTIGDAKAFATLGECSDEWNIINYLTDEKYNYSTLKEPYYTYATAKLDNNISDLQSLAKSSNSSERTKSIAYRMIASILIEKGEYLDAVSNIEYAKEIDSRYAWTSNLLDNERLLLEAYKLMDIDTKIVQERINILESAIINKF